MGQTRPIGSVGSGHLVSDGVCSKPRAAFPSAAPVPLSAERAARAHVSGSDDATWAFRQLAAQL